MGFWTEPLRDGVPQWLSHWVAALTTSVQFLVRQQRIFPKLFKEGWAVPNVFPHFTLLFPFPLQFKNPPPPSGLYLSRAFAPGEGAGV